MLVELRDKENEETEKCNVTYKFSLYGHLNRYNIKHHQED